MLPCVPQRKKMRLISHAKFRVTKVLNWSFIDLTDGLEIRILTERIPSLQEDNTRGYVRRAYPFSIDIMRNWRHLCQSNNTKEL